MIPTEKSILFRISAPHFVAGIECYDFGDRPIPIHRTAPILGYMVAWSLDEIMRYCKRKGWEIDEV